MGVRYSYDDFTTKGHGVIEYASTNSSEDGPKRKRRPKTKSKFATRWPSAAPLKKRKSTVDSKESIDKRALAIFKQRFPGQQPKKGQIKGIKKELIKATNGNPKTSKQNHDPALTFKKQKTSENKIDTLTLAMFERRFPGQQPKKGQLEVIRKELIEARKKIGL